MNVNYKNLFLSVVNNLQDGVYIVDPQRRIVFWNKAAEEITGYSAKEIVGKHCQSNLLNHISKEGTPLCLVGCPLFASINDGKQRKEEVFLRHKNGHRIPIRTNIFPIMERGITIGAVEIFTVASPKVYEDDLIATLTEAAMKDNLTKLPNRKYLSSFMEYQIVALQRFGTNFCVVFGDIDHFSVFNNTYGHEVGDKVLIAVADSIRYTLRSSDMWGRWGGEEFLGIFTVNNDKEARAVGEKMRVLVAGTQVPHEGESLSVTMSLGVTMARRDDTIDSIVARADEAMYQSKTGGRNRVTVK